MPALACLPACLPRRHLPQVCQLAVGADLAKGCGQLLNLNCALIAVPVLTEVMRYLNQAGSRYQGGTARGGGIGVPWGLAVVSFAPSPEAKSLFVCGYRWVH